MRAHKDFSLLGAEALLARLEELTRESAGVRRAADREHLHRMRVASRRVRAVLSLCGDCWPPGRVKIWRRQMRGLTRALGMARDTDVQIEFVERRLDRLAAADHAPGLRRLLLRLQQRRERQQAGVTAALARLERSGIVADIARHFAAPLQQARSRQGDGRAAGAWRPAREAIAPRLAAVLAGGSCLQQPELAAEQHQLRIAVKRLRYALEIIQPLAPQASKAALKPLKELQERLGDLHDCDVWLELLPRFAEKERRRTLDYFGHARPFAQLKVGLSALAAQLREERAERHAAALALWNNLAADGFFAALNDLPPPPPQQAAAPREVAG